MQTKFVILVSVLLGSSITFGRPQGEITGNEIEPANGEEPINFGATYQQFFRIKDIIDKISLKNFKGRFDDIGVVPIVAPAVDDVTTVEVATEEAPSAATVGLISVVTEPITAAPATEAPIEATTQAAIEELEVVTEAAVEAATTEAAIAVTTEAAVEVVTDAVTEAVEVIPRIVNEVVEEETAVEEESAVDETEETFFISDDTAEAAKKYGFKILLKKINGKSIPVGKINVQFPTVVEIIHEEETATAAAAVEEAPVEEVAVEEVAVEEVAVEEVAVEETTVAAVEETTAAVVFPEVVDEVVPIVEEISPRDVTTIIPDDVVTAFIPEADEVSVESIADGVAHIAENAEIAIDSIIERTGDSNIVPEGVFPGCAPTNAEIEDMLVVLTKNVQKSAPVLKELLYVAKSLKGETDPAVLSRNGAKLLRLLEPFLESLVPPQVAGCSPSSTESVMMSLMAVGKRMDDIATNEISSDRADALREAATNLQLAGWVLGQLQDTVNTFYSEEGRCATNSSDTGTILQTLAIAMEGYRPIVAMLGNEEAVEDLEATVEAISRAADIIMGLEDDTGAALPGVACGASFEEMAQALDNLANFIGALSIRV